MPNCPQCAKPLRDFSRRCPSCQADLDLLVDYVSHLQGGLERAENLVKAGELGQAIWAYLEVLEVDPDNPQARKQVGTIVTAVRQFDNVVPGRRWANGLPPLPTSDAPWWRWPFLGLCACLLVIVSYSLGRSFADYYLVWPSNPASGDVKPPENNQIGEPRLPKQ